VKARKVVNAIDRGKQGRSGYWVFGINVVLRRIEVRPGSVREICILPRRGGRLSEVVTLANRLGIPIRESEPATLDELTGTPDHQGVAALSEPYPYAEIDGVMASDARALLLLDQVQDPRNLGALLRTAAAVGMDAVILPRHDAVGVTPTVEKASAGTALDVAVCRVTNLSRVLEMLKTRDFWSVACVPRDGENLFEMTLPERTVLVLGGESGLRPLVERSCDLRASIPLEAGVESLNTSVAGAIAMYELRRRRGA
jgi:23S rRNA (guanosine2251-2'-O)-methyltransferase